MTQTLNPLRQFFRQPAIYIRLPSRGAFWPDGSLDIPENGELPVFPMTAVDEITYRTPDALFNGQAVVDVVQSCIPAIRNAWHIPAQDFNAIMVAIRIASYGHDMELETTCPECKNQDGFKLDLRTVIENLRSPDYSKSLTVNGLDIVFQPLDFRNQNAVSTEQFECQRLIQAIPESDLADDVKVQEMAKVMKRLQDLTLRVLAAGISSVRTPSTLVTESEFISEFLENCDRETFNRVREHIISMRQSTELKPLRLKCTACQHEHEQQLNLDQASFFAVAS